MDSEMQGLIDELETVKSNLKSKIQSVLGKNLSNVTFEEYYRYINVDSSLNTQKTYASVPDNISGKLQRLNQVKQFLKEAIEDNLNQNLTNVEFKDYPNYIKKEYSLKSLKESTFYQGWKYRVQVLLNGKPAGAGITGTFSLYRNSGSTADVSEKTTDENGILSITINWNPGTHLFKTTCQGKTISETVVVSHAMQERTANAVSQGVSVSGRSRAWTNLTVSNLGAEEPNNYASCLNLASKSGTYNTPYYVDLTNFKFSLPANSVVKSVDLKYVARLSKNAPSNPEFTVNTFIGDSNSLVQASTGKLEASKATSWQYLTFANADVNILNKLTTSLVNSQNLKVRVQYSTNENYNVGDIYWTYYKLIIYYSPPQNIWIVNFFFFFKLIVKKSTLLHFSQTYFIHFVVI